jgi:tetratricopeptide (TPR) repeat protein
MTAIKVIGKYLWLLVWPARLSPDYSFNQVPLVNWPPRTWDDWQAAVALLLCVAAALFGILSYRRRRLVFLLVAFFFAALAPVSNLVVVIGSIMAERFLYMPAIAFAGCVVMAVYAACGLLAKSGAVSRWAALALLAVICLALAARTYARNFDWLDDRSLWSNAVQSVPASYKAHMALASSLVTPANARLDDAIAEIEKAFAILSGVPDDLNSPAPYIDAGSYYGQKGKSVARRNADGALEITPQSRLWYNKALETLLHARRIEAANNRANRRREQMRGRTYKDNGWYELYLELAAVYLRLSEPRKALDALREGGKYKPVPEYFEKAAEAHAALGDLRQAAIDLSAAVVMDPDELQIAVKLARQYQQTDHGGCALGADGRGLNIDCPIVHDNLCTGSGQVASLYDEAGMEAAAETTRQRAVRDLRCAPPAR